MKYLNIIMMLCGFTLLGAQSTFAGYPYVAYSSETKLMGGAFSFYRYILEEPTPQDKGSHIAVLSNTIYSQKNQFLLAIIPQYHNDEWALSWSLVFQDWPDTFYGTGNFTDADDAEKFTSRRYAIDSRISRELGRNLELYGLASQGWHKVRKSVSNGFMQSSQLEGFDPGFYSGLGLGIAFDSTDGSYYPKTGIKAELQRLFFSDILGSDYNYSESKIDLRAYLTSSPVSVLALQSDLVTHDGNTPFYNYPELSARLRAFDGKRFIDALRISQRIENRVFPFSGNFSRRLGFVLFAEVGQVAEDIQSLALKDLHYSVGGGLRFSILPDEKLNLRADFGFWGDDMNFIINAREVF